MFRHVLTAVATIAATSLSGAALASAVCDQLRFDLSNFHEDTTRQAEARKFARAIAEQKSNIRQVEFTQRQEGCSAGSMVMVEQVGKSQCNELEAKHARMERNLEILEEKRISLLSEDSDKTARDQLVAALDKNDCNDMPALVGTPTEDTFRAPLVQDDLDGRETIRVPADDPGYAESQFVDLGGASMNGSFQTMCVRTCDGAYFPISSRASTIDFRRDAQVCSMMCPGAETELFYHPIQEESAVMRSASDGRPYQDLPAAYRYRTRDANDKDQCGCNFSLYYKEMMKREAYVATPDARQPKQSSITWIKPELRGGLKPSPERAEARPKPVERDYRPSDKIRIIGPHFLPDDRSIDFRHPKTSSGEAG